MFCVFVRVLDVEMSRFSFNRGGQKIVSREVNNLIMFEQEVMRSLGLFGPRERETGRDPTLHFY